VVAQRLIRRLCPHCKVPVPPESEKVRAVMQMLSPVVREQVRTVTLTVHEPRGCPKCAGAGYRGRTGIFEVLRVTERIEELIIAHATAAQIREQAVRDGMRTLRQAGLRKVIEGETSIAEVLEHTIADTAEAPAAQAAAVGAANV